MTNSKRCGMTEMSIREGHSVLACPVCSKQGEGRGVLQAYRRRTKPFRLFCVVCGWKGEYDTVQSYQFPCLIYHFDDRNKYRRGLRVVEMDIEVVENILSTALQLSMQLALNLPPQARKRGILEYHNLDGGLETEIPAEWDLKNALRYLITTGWLFPAGYRIQLNV